MADTSFTEQVEHFKGILEQIEQRVAHGEVGREALADFKSTVDDLRLRLWGMLGTTTTTDYRAFQERFRLRRAKEICRGLEDDLRAGALDQQHDELRALGQAAASLAARIEALAKRTAPAEPVKQRRAAGVTGGSTIPQWHVEGDWFDVCKCNVPCPCTFAQAPSYGDCDGILAYHIRRGRYGDVALDGLNLIGVGSFAGNIWEGETKATMGFFIDQRASESQRAALQTIWGGQAGGFPAMFASLIGELRGIEVAPIEFEIADDLAHWRAEIPGRVVAGADALTGPMTPPGQRVQTLNAPGSEMGPGTVATWGRATADSVDAFGFKWEWAGRSSKHIAFDWSGPDTA